MVDPEVRRQQKNRASAKWRQNHPDARRGYRSPKNAADQAAAKEHSRRCREYKVIFASQLAEMRREVDRAVSKRCFENHREERNNLSSKYYRANRDERIRKQVAYQKTPEAKAKIAAAAKVRAKNPASWLKSQLSKLKSRAKQRGFGFDLVPQDFTIPETCPVLGIPLALGLPSRSPNSPSFDRVDNNLGYVKGNVRIISLRANRLKSNATLYEMERVTQYMRGEL